MSFEAARAQLERCGLADRILEFEPGATATVALAAQRIGCRPEHIAKSVALLLPEGTEHGAADPAAGFLPVK